MDNSIDFQQNKQSRKYHDTWGFDPQVILLLILKHWYWFVITTVLSLFLARLYISHTMPTYQTSVTILINETEERPLVDNSELLQGLGLPGGMKNLENQIMVLKSRALTEKTLSQLPFETDYYFKTFRNQLPIYPEIPIRITAIDEIQLPKDIEFAISFLNDSTFNLVCESKYFPLNKTATFSESIEISGGNFRIESLNKEWISRHKDRVLYFIIHSRSGLINYYSNRIIVDLVSRDGSVLRISMIGTNIMKDVDFLNKHVENFQSISYDKKNTEAERRIQFIDDQLVGISDSLSITENRLQQFRSSHRVMDLSAQGQAIIGQVTLLENEKARLELEANYYDYLADYLAKDEEGKMLIVPVTMGITDPGLTRLVNELSDLQSQLTTRGAGERNPLQRNLELKVNSTKDALRETLNGLRRANSLARSENQDQINKANAQASALPITERQLLGIERKFQLNNELYTFLLETRAEQEMQKASNRADSEVIDPADGRFSSMVAPDRRKIYFLGLFLGFGIPSVFIFLVTVFNKKLKYEDINKLAGMSIVGNIPHNSEKTSIIVLSDPNSSVAEAFRLLRSRMQFFIKDAISPVILVTSSIPGEGKTFVAINLASVYSLLGKRTILVGFDLRKPKIFKDFNLSNEKGISTWLIGKDKLEDIVQQTPYECLSVISSGPIPPNPSELTALPKTTELIQLLKHRYDYVIVDSSPIGLVSDTYHLAAQADACLLILRPGHTLRDGIEGTLNEMEATRLRSPGLVINDIQSDSKHYGYGEKFGYTGTRNRLKKRLFKTKN